MALILVDHGSQFAAANEMLDEVVALVRRAGGAGFVAVEPAHMELASPTIEQAVSRCAAAGAKRVVVSLFFLSPGRHSTSDIPRLAAEAARKHPGVEVAISEPFGLDERLVPVILDRARQALADLEGGGWRVESGE